MPNHVRNKIQFKTLDDFMLVSEFCKNDVCSTIFDFNKLIPAPGYIFQGDLGKEERRKYGENNWYDWNIRNWGTKWNAYSGELDKENFAILFSTAWAMPEPICQTLSAQFPDVDFTWKWADEDLGFNTGIYRKSGGELLEINVSNESNEAYGLYIELHGSSECIGMDEDGVHYKYDCDNCPNRYRCGID